MNESDLIYNCPGCGKSTPAELGAWTNKCHYCGLIVRIATPGSILKYFYPSKVDLYGARMAADRFLKESQLSLTGNIIKAEFFYLPFYRFRAIALNYLSTMVEPELNSSGEENPEPPIVPAKKFVLKGKDFDVTMPAIANDNFKFSSLGIRPAAVPLYSFCPTDIPKEAVIIGTDISPQQVETQAQELHKANLGLYANSNSIYSAMIGEQISVIYFPIWALTHKNGTEEKTVLIDALAKRGYYQTEAAFTFDGKASISQNSKYIDPQRHQCPNCGADLPDAPFSLYYPCKNCNRAYLLGNDGYTEIKPKTADAPVCAPYWRFPLELSADRSYKTVNDFSKLLVSEISLLNKAKKDRQFYLYSPAFRNTDTSRWAESALSVVKTQPHDDLKDNAIVHGLDLSLSESEGKQMAAFLWKIATARYLKLQTAQFHIDENALSPGDLVWLPANDPNLLAKSKNYKQVNVVEK